MIAATNAVFKPFNLQKNQNPKSSDHIFGKTREF